jgi:hypothetical protein
MSTTMLHMFIFKTNILIIKEHEVLPTLRSQKNEWKVYIELSKTGFDEFWKYNFFLFMTNKPIIS